VFLVHSLLTAIALAAPATGPLRLNPANQTQFINSATGKIIHLSGGHTWNNFQDYGETLPVPVFDFSLFVDFLNSRGHNITRLWSWQQSKWVPWSTSEHFFSESIY
jgi:hypothetical protein